MSRTLLLALVLVLGTSLAHAQVGVPSTTPVVVPGPPQGQTCFQVIHLSEVAAFAAVDVYLNGGLVAEDLPYQGATPCLRLKSGESLLTVALPDGGQVITETALSVAGDASGSRQYQVLFNGVIPTVGDAPSTAFADSDRAYSDEIGLTVMSALQPTGDRLSVGYVFDDANAQPHDVLFGPALLATRLEYGGLSARIEAPATDVRLTLKGAQASVSFVVPMRGFAGQSLTLIAAGGDGVLPQSILMVTADGAMQRVDPEVERPAMAAQAGLSASVRVGGAAPNPFSGATALGVELDAPADVSVEVFDVQGRRVSAVAPHGLSVGTHRVPVTMSAGPGLYLYRVTVVANGATGVWTGRMVSVQ